MTASQPARRYSSPPGTVDVARGAGGPGRSPSLVPLLPEPQCQGVRDYAEQCAETKDYPTAAAQFARYLAFCPDDAAARVRLAETYDLAYSKLGRVQRAIELYREALGVASRRAKGPDPPPSGRIIAPDAAISSPRRTRPRQFWNAIPGMPGPRTCGRWPFTARPARASSRTSPEIVGTSLETRCRMTRATGKRP